MAERQYWITGINPEKYNIKKSLASRDEIDWCLKVGAKEKVEVGDIVYIYTYTYPRGCKEDEYVNFKIVVVATDIEPKDRIEDKEFVTEMGTEDITDGKKFTRLKLLQTFPDFLPVSCLVVRSLHLKKTMTQPLQSDCTDYMSLHDNPKYFPKGCFSYLIDKFSKDKSLLYESSIHSKYSKIFKTPLWEGIAENVRLVLPQLVSYVREGSSHISYFELLGIFANSKPVVPIEVIMSIIHDVLTTLSKETKQEIPTLNAVVTDLFTGLPNHKFDYVFKGFEDLGKEEKLKVLEGFSAKALLYKNWDWVLSMLGLGHKIEKELIEKAHKESFGFSEEGEKEREVLKQKISQNPSEHTIYSYVKGEIDYLLLSGDRVDLYFPDIYTAVVLIPSTATEEEVFRGINQCVKFKALLEAEAKYNGDFNEMEVILGLSEELTPRMRKIAKFMNVRDIEHLGWTEEQHIEYLRYLDLLQGIL